MTLTANKLVQLVTVLFGELGSAHIMAPTLYMVPPSPPVRAVLMTAKAIGLELEIKEIDLKKGEHKTPEFLKMNPQHTVPTLVDEDGFIIWDSHAIMPYLLSKYGNDETLYPRDPQERALVDQRLHFDSGVVFARALRIVKPIVYEGKKTVDQQDIEALEEIYGFTEAFLEGRDWIAGDHVTIADFSLLTSITSLNVLHEIDPSKYPRIVAWIKRAEELPAYEGNRVGLDFFNNFIRSLMA